MTFSEYQIAERLSPGVRKFGLWSHKPGSTKVRYYDYDGHIIVAPHASRRESNSHNYKKSCGYFCYNPKKSTMSNKPIK